MYVGHVVNLSMLSILLKYVVNFVNIILFVDIVKAIPALIFQK